MISYSFSGISNQINAVKLKKYAVIGEKTLAQMITAVGL